MKKPSVMTTLCYIEKEDSYLMLHRVVKKNESAVEAILKREKALRNAFSGRLRRRRD